MSSVILTFSRKMKFLLLVLFSLECISSEILRSNQILSKNQTLVSTNRMFELGYFHLEGDGGVVRWYLGIWYVDVSPRNYVWVANRDTPLLNSRGTLSISENCLKLHDDSGKTIWRSSGAAIPSGRLPRAELVAELLDSGNFVLRYSYSTPTMTDLVYLWESFDYPTDTLLPGMKIGWDKRSRLNRNITAWRSENDPSTGDYSYKIDTGGRGRYPQRFLLKKTNVVHRSDTWNRVGNNGIRAGQQSNTTLFNFTITSEEVTYSYVVKDNNLRSKLIISSRGLLERFNWPTPSTKEWILMWYAPADQCDRYAFCGDYSYCDVSTSPHCNCMKGFKPRHEQEWSSGNWKGGCERKTPLTCNDTTDFIHLTNVKLPDVARAIVDKDVQQCRKRCARDCNCTAYAKIDFRNCVLWKSTLLDTRIFTVAGETLFIKLAHVDVDIDKKTTKRPLIIGICVGIVLLVCAVAAFVVWRRRRRRRPKTAGETTSEMSYQDLLIATGNFSDENKLGRGGYGVVYRGTLRDGKEVAVKRLTKVSSPEGMSQFTNELESIQRVQHINLVRLIGSCQQQEEYLLVYEYLSNLSLDLHLFSGERSKLTFETRIDIVKGIARGLSYLHQDSRYRVIHRDLKASNVLLDDQMIPKIADFGMARLFERNQTEIKTETIVGTYGYICPAYRSSGAFSTKTDVFSFGVLLLEIMTGRKCARFSNAEGDLSLVECVWRNWEQGTLSEVFDPFLLVGDDAMIKEAARFFHIALLCVQDLPEDRPSMSSVVVMLESDSSIPRPKSPGYTRKKVFEIGSSSSVNDSWTVNKYSLSAVEPR